MSVLRSPEIGFAVLLASAMKVTLLLGLAWMIAGVARQRPAAFRHLVWLLGLIAALTLPALITLLPEWHSNALRSVSGALQAATHDASSASGSPTPLSFVVNANTAPLLPGTLATWALMLWLTGVVAVVLRLTVGVARLAWMSRRAHTLTDENWRRLVAKESRRIGIARTVSVRQSDDRAAMPVTWGVFRPVILVPATASEWSDERRRIVICHELSHISRGDWTRQMLGELTRGVYWFHPLAWLAARRLRQESEFACDDLVLRSGVAPGHYASELLELARTLATANQAWSAALALTRRSHLERRFTSMLNPSTNHNCLTSKVRMAAVLFTLCTLVPIAALRLPAQSLPGKLSGIVYDPSGAKVPNATVIMTNAKSKTVDMTTSDSQGEFRFAALPVGEYEMKVLKPGFAAFTEPQVTIEASRDTSQNATLKMGTVTEDVDVVAQGSGKPQESKTPRVRLGGEVQAPKIVSKLQPVYPQTAKSAGSQGIVVLHAIIGMNGSPLSLRVVNSEIDPELARAAVEAVSKWRYSPTLLNGQPIEVDTTIKVNFTLAP